MKRDDIPAFLAFAPGPSLVISKTYDIVFANRYALTSLNAEIGRPLNDYLTEARNRTGSLAGCFRSTTAQRLAMTDAKGDKIICTGFRVGSRACEDELVCLKLQYAQTVSATFSHLTLTLRREREHRRRLLAHNRLLRSANEQLAQQASQDHMTGLLNAHAFRNQLESRVRDGGTFGLIYLDLNNLKRINDEIGHYAGDVVILQLAESIKDQIRSGDIAARLGGDEFAVLLNDIKDIHAISAICLRISHAIERKSARNAWHGTVSSSVAIGVALWPQDGDTVAILEHHADQAMFESKRQGHPLVFAQQIAPQSTLRAM